jgi:hypothetical protein
MRIYTMRKPLVVLAAALMAAGTFVYVQQCVWADDYGGGGKTGMKADVGHEKLPQGITAAPADQIDNTGIRTTLVKSIDNAFAGNCKEFATYLTATDRNRLGDPDKTKEEQFNKTLTQFREAWKAKYNQDWDLASKQEVVFGPNFQGFLIVQGEVSNPALLGNWPVEPRTGESMEQPKERTPDVKKEDDHATAGAPGNPPINLTPKEGERGGKAAARELDRGTTVAVVYFPAWRQTEEVAVSLIREGGARAEMRVGREEGAGMEAGMGGNWKIDIPDTLDGPTLGNNINKHLTAIMGMKDQWPNDVNDAYRLVCQHFYMALYDTGAGQPHLHSDQPDYGNQPKDDHSDK